MQGWVPGLTSTIIKSWTQPERQLYEYMEKENVLIHVFDGGQQTRILKEAVAQCGLVANGLRMEHGSLQAIYHGLACC